MAKIVFADIKSYLDAIADNVVGNTDESPHKRFWNVTYAEFVNGNIPGVTSSGSPIAAGQSIPIINKADPKNSSFFAILKGSFAGKPQMPDGGPLITDQGFQVTVGGKTVTGTEIQANIQSWLENGFPEM